MFDFLIGQPCWGIVAGPGSGSWTQLLLGQKIPRKHPAKNSFLSDLIRNNDAEFRLSLFNCSWRITTRTGILCSAFWSSNEVGGPMLSGLAKLENRRILSTRVNPETLDTSFGFEDELRLCVFNDYPSEPGEDRSAFWITTPEKRYAVRDFRLTIEKKPQD